jgi:hypothetical protein
MLYLTSFYSLHIPAKLSSKLHVWIYFIILSALLQNEKYASEREYCNCMNIDEKILPKFWIESLLEEYLCTLNLLIFWNYSDRRRTEKRTHKCIRTEVILQRSFRYAHCCCLFFLVFFQYYYLWVWCCFK